MSRPPLKVSYWLAACWFTLAIPVSGWLAVDRESLSLPQTPVDRIDGDLAASWRFLQEARHAVLPGESYTVRAERIDLEMMIYMMSLGLTTRRQGYPTSYHNFPTPEEGAKAEKVLAFRDFTGDEEKLELVVRFRDGAVYRRSGGE
jgi:hypothetical protein